MSLYSILVLVHFDFSLLQLYLPTSRLNLVYLPKASRSPLTLLFLPVALPLPLPVALPLPSPIGDPLPP